MKRFLIISFSLLLGCEQVVIIVLPQEQNLIVVEGWVTNVNERQYVRLSRSNSFSGTLNPVIEDATVIVQVKDGISQTYSYAQNGNYMSDSPYQGLTGEEYRVSIVLSNGDLVRSLWSKMETTTEIVLLSVDSFEENDPDNPGQTKTIYFPRITARDSANYENYYRWILYSNGFQITVPESIILQNDRFFDGNFIPNFFDDFEYSFGNNMKVELHSITKETFDYLNLLRSQTTTLSAASSTTPAIVNGNIFNLSNSSETILGYFGTSAISADSTIVQ